MKIQIQSRCKRFISWLARLAGIDLLRLAHNEMGILKYQDLAITGEQYLVESVLPLLTKRARPVLVDVGANIGEFAKLLRTNFRTADIWAFEPVSATFAELQENTKGLNIRCLDCGLGSREESMPIYLSDRPKFSVMASLYSKVPELVHRFDDTVVEAIRVRTLDAVALENELEFIDFLKVDTEGHELEVLRGGLNLINSNRVGSILFEFNVMNTISKVFLRDFYDALPGYNFYRLDTRRLISLGSYDPANEIFLFQNIFAINTSLNTQDVIARLLKQ